MQEQKPRLIAIALSHYCEKVRWALDYLGIDYVEEITHRLSIGNILLAMVEQLYLF